MPSGYTAALPNDILLDQGLLYVGATPVGATKDALSFDPGREMRNVEFAGKRSDIAGLDRITRWNPRITTTLALFGTAQIAWLEPGAASATNGGTTTWTPTDAGVLIPTGSLLTNVRAIWPRGSGGFAQVRFPKGIVVTWSLAGGDNDEVGVSVEIAARLDMGAGGATTDDAPYVIEHLGAI